MKNTQGRTDSLLFRRMCVICGEVRAYKDIEKRNGLRYCGDKSSCKAGVVANAVARKLLPEGEKYFIDPRHIC